VANHQSMLSPTKHVRFSTTSPEVAATPQWYTEIQDYYLQEGWWSKEESESIKESALCEADSFFHCRRDAPSPNRRSYLRIMEEIDCVSMEEDQFLSDSWSEDLVYWLVDEVDHSRRGLEKYIVDHAEISRQQRKQLVKEAVLFVQDICEESTCYEQMSELLRVASEAVTKPGAKFARIMGAIDEVAARMECGDGEISENGSHRVVTLSRCCVQTPRRERSSRRKYRHSQPPQMGYFGGDVTINERICVPC